MGTNCGKHLKPVPTNSCDGGVIDIPHFCSFLMTGKREFCREIGDGEWVYDSSHGFCFFDGITDFGFGCCHGTCGIPFGSKLRCRRVSYKADPTKCCLQDYVCSKNCFVDNKTCDPKYRDSSTPECKQRIMSYCTTGEDLLDKWNNECYRSLWRILYKRCIKEKINGLPFDTENFLFAKKMITTLFERYLASGGVLTDDPTTTGDNTLDGVLYKICYNTPSLCEDFLSRYCVNRKPSKWCGCYTKQFDLMVPRECLPSCNRSGVIGISTNNKLGKKICDSTMCVMDDNTISIFKSEIGTISFEQLCGTCLKNGGGCSCYILNNTIKAIDGNVGEINLSQNCDSAFCFKDGKQVDCFSDIKPTVIHPHEKIAIILLVSFAVTMLLITIHKFYNRYISYKRTL